MESVSYQRRANRRHRQAVANLVHLRRDTGPEIAITAAAIDRPNLDHQDFEQFLVAHFCSLASI